MNQSTFWNKIASKYDTSVQKNYAQAYNQTISKIKENLQEHYHVLDIGCGTGIITNQIADNVSYVIGIDTSEKMLDIPKEKANTLNLTNVQYILGSLDELSDNQKTFDAIIAANVLYFIRDIHRFLENIRSKLKDGGVFISVTDCLGEKWSFKNVLLFISIKLGLLPWMKLFTIKSLKSIIGECGFTIKGEQNLYPYPPNYLIIATKK